MKRSMSRFLMFFITASAYIFLCFLLTLMPVERFVPSGKSEKVVISAGMSAKDAAEAISQAGIVGSSKDLMKWMIRLNADKNLRPGLYELKPGSPYYVAKQLKAAKPESFKVTLIPGMRYWSIAKTVFNDSEQTGKLAEALADDENFPQEIRELLPDRAENRIAFMLPETFFSVPDDEVGRDIVRRASALWVKKVFPLLPENIGKDKLFEMSVLASVVEGEAKITEERPILAGIFINRIEKRMRLQSCATVIYSWEQHGVKKKSLSYNDLKIDSPYNTYKNDGLPPAPINIPSLDSWKSAISPTKTDYLFFFATPEGNHIFSKTYDEHLKKQRELSK